MSSLPDMGVDEKLVTFETGATRTTSTEMYAYARISPIALRALARAYAEGKKKYEAFNCERGMSVELLLEHAIDHIYSFLEGDRSEDHLGHCLWNVAMAIHSLVMWPHLNDNLRRPHCRPPITDLDTKGWAEFSRPERGSTQPSKARYAGSHAYWDKLEAAEQSPGEDRKHEGT